MAYPWNPTDFGDIPVSGRWGTSSITDTYATHIDYLGQGGYQAYDTVANRDTITAARRAFGMAVSCADTNIVYRLCNVAMGGNSNTLTDNLNWIPFAGGGALALETNGVVNGSSVLLNLVAGANMTITDDGFGDITFDSAGGAASLTTSYVGFGDGSNLLTGSKAFTYDTTGSYLAFAKTQHTTDDIFNALPYYVSGGDLRSQANGSFYEMDDASKRFRLYTGSAFGVARWFEVNMLTARLEGGDLDNTNKHTKWILDDSNSLFSVDYGATIKQHWMSVHNVGLTQWGATSLGVDNLAAPNAVNGKNVYFPLNLIAGTAVVDILLKYNGAAAGVGLNWDFQKRDETSAIAATYTSIQTGTSTNHGTITTSIALTSPELIDNQHSYQLVLQAVTPGIADVVKLYSCGWDAYIQGI